MERPSTSKGDAYYVEEMSVGGSLKSQQSAPVQGAPLLGLTGVTINSMALIAPGAFLWTTYSLNLACIDNQLNSFAKDTFVGIIFAVWVAFMTAFPFAELAHVYPEAGAGGAYYFAERAFKHSKIRAVRGWSNIMKWYMGFSIHLFYWVYPGVTTALMSQVIVYLINTSPSRDPTSPLSPGAAAGIAIMCALVVALIAIKGVNFSTSFNTGVVIMQSAAIFMYGVLWACYRDKNKDGPPPIAANPSTVTTATVPAGDKWLFETAGDIFTVHSGLGMVYQSSIAILILVGFDSSTQLGAETKKPERNVAIGCVLSLALQALLSYPFEYVSASAAMPASFQTAASMAPIGDLTIVAGNHFGLNGYALMCIQAITVLLSIFGTTLAASNAAVRVSLFMATERQFPSFMCRLHPTWRTPWIGICMSAFINSALGIACVSNKDAYNNTIAITAITMASNVGTFLLYAGICFTCIINFWGKPHELTLSRSVQLVAARVRAVYRDVAQPARNLRDLHRGDHEREPAEAAGRRRHLRLLRPRDRLRLAPLLLHHHLLRTEGRVRLQGQAHRDGGLVGAGAEGQRAADSDRRARERAPRRGLVRARPRRLHLQDDEPAPRVQPLGHGRRRRRRGLGRNAPVGVRARGRSPAARRLHQGRRPRRHPDAHLRLLPGPPRHRHRGPARGLSRGLSAFHSYSCPRAQSAVSDAIQWS